MYIISNKQMEDAIKFIEAYRKSVNVNACDTRTYNSVRLAGILLKKLRAKQPLSEDLSGELKNLIPKSK